MNRRLLIISNDGGKDEHLAGVKVDVKSYLNFFKSAEGGAWDKDEYKVCKTGTFTPAKLNLYIKKREIECHIDFWLIVFVGHGGADPDGRTYFCFTNQLNCYEDQISFWTKNSRCLLIADSCRSVEYTDKKIIERLVYFSESKNEDEQYRLLCKKIYNRKIEKVPIGVMQKGYATKYRHYAGEFSNGTGGYYSQSLIKIAKEEIENAKRMRKRDPNSFNGEIASFSWIHTQAKKRVEELTNGEQSPVLYSVRTNQFPFYVVPPFLCD